MNEIVTRWSSWSKLQRRVAWIRRFCRWIASKRTACNTGILSLEELNEATNVIVRSVQTTCFSDELSELKRKGEVKKTIPVADLRPLEVDGVLCVGGKLQAAENLSFDERHPMILPKRHHLSELIVRHFHEVTAHGGREQTLYEMRRKFWIVAGRSLVKDTVRRCIECRRMNARAMHQVIAPLPKTRVEAYQPPFTYAGVDLFGPMTVKWGRGTAKRWGCLFTCLNTRAVYLDVVPSLEADDFIMILRQFVSRRGPPNEIWSDRGTNFVGANNELQGLYCSVE
ncbi:uncharacterized protein LOC116300350 [Actinia tenebrosa]|uniref:Uncharacterized protein LOC116300350 n=1 Tax=Actinia tenebrosa TaxID=6105 RepID=A0A6P8I927_ACTTE|nr:uncharacterized protein LOC116300350 [Actinia tenebrosa]